MGSWILRLLLYLICGISGYFLAVGLSSSTRTGVWGILGGFLLATLTLLLEGELKKIPLRHLIGSFIGLVLGMMLANLISNVFFSNLINHQQITLSLLAGLYGICGFIGLRIGLKKGEEIQFSGWNLFSKSLPGGDHAKILDTSVIIDGRSPILRRQAFWKDLFSSHSLFSMNFSTSLTPLIRSKEPEGREDWRCFSISKNRPISM